MFFSTIMVIIDMATTMISKSVNFGE